MEVRLTVAGLALAGALAGCGSTGEPNRTAAEPPSAAADYVGVGSQILGPVTFRAGVDAVWTSTGGLFMLIATSGPAAMANPQLIVSQAPSGTGYIPPGRYVMKVSTWSDSSWTVTWRPRR